VAGLAGCWVLLLIVTGSVLAGTALLLLLAGLGAGLVAGLRLIGVDVGRPRADGGAAGGYRDAAGGYQNAGAYRDAGGYRDAGVYQDQVAARDARFASPGGPGAAWPRPDDDFGHGHDGFRYGHDENVPGPADGRNGYADGHGGYSGHNGYVGGHDGRTRGEAALAGPVEAGAPTVAELRGPPIPLLRLVTGDSVVQTRISGACAGRGPVDLVLPEVPTVSREHARFTFADGEWRVVNLGRNGLMLNDVPLNGPHAIRDGDVIRWGRTADALMSRVEIG
jgi:hypothetical protein